MLTKQSYPLSIVVNKEGRRFIDEGDDFRNYTHAKYGAAILERPGVVAFQLFHKTVPLLRQDEFTAPGVSRYESAPHRRADRTTRHRTHPPGAGDLRVQLRGAVRVLQSGDQRWWQTHGRERGAH